MSGAATGDVVWAGGERWRVVPGMSRIFGFSFSYVVSGGTGYEGTDPLGGAFLLRHVWAENYVVARATNMHSMGLAVGENVPSSPGEFDAAESLFPWGGALRSYSRRIWFGGRYGGLNMPWGWAVNFRGRRLVGFFRNGSTASGDCFVGVVADELERWPVEEVGDVARPGIMGALSAAAAAARGS